MPLSDHVSLTITQDSTGIARAGFGFVAHVSYNAAWVERVRSYSSYAEVVEDFDADMPEALFAAQVFGQSPHPNKLYIVRGALKPTKKYTVDVVTVANSQAYTIPVKGEGVTATEATYTSDSAATQAEIHNGIATALNAVVGKNYTAEFAPLVVADFTFTAEADDDKLTATAHGLLTGDGPVRVSNSGGALPTGLVAATDYWVIRFDADNFYLATSLANALAGTQINLTTDGTGTQTLSDTASTVRPDDPFTVEGDAAGDWFSLQVDPAFVKISETHSDPGIATDLAAIMQENSDWYMLHTSFNSNAMVAAAAAWVQSNKKIYAVEVSDTESITTAVGNSDTLDDLATLGYSRVMGVYHPAPDQMLAAAWDGRVLPIDPGGVTWKFKTLEGVAPVTLTSTQRNNLTDRNANSYETVAGRNITFEGTSSDGDFFDVVRDLDWLEDDMAKGVFGVLAGNNKVPFTDLGVAVVVSEVRASLNRAVARGILSEDTPPVVNYPLVVDVSSADKALRILPDVKFSAVLAGAIHRVVIVGTVSV